MKGDLKTELVFGSRQRLECGARGKAGVEAPLFRGRIIIPGGDPPCMRAPEAGLTFRLFVELISEFRDGLQLKGVEGS